MTKIAAVALAMLLCTGCVALEKAVESNGISHISELKVGISVGQNPDGTMSADVGFRRRDLTFVKDTETGHGSYEHRTKIGAQPGDIIDETKVTLGR